MWCKYKLNLNDEPITVEFSDWLDLPKNLVYLHLYEDIDGFYFKKFKKLVDLKIENIKLKNIDLLSNIKLEILHIENVVLDDVKLIEKNILSLTLNFCIIFNKDIFKKFTDLSNLIVNNVDLSNINLLENKLDHLKLHRTNLNELKIYKDDLETLTLNRGYIEDINILEEYTNLEYLNIENVRFSSNKIIFPKINLEYLRIDSNDNIEEINLNNLNNLKELSIGRINLLKKLYINELKNLKELHIYVLENLDILNFEKSKLDYLFYNEVTNLKYIDGYTKTSEVEEAGKQLLKQKVLSRRRIYLLSENPTKGPVEDGLCEGEVGTRNELSESQTKENKTGIICGKCGKYVSSSNKINIRNNKLMEYLERTDEITHVVEFELDGQIHQDDQIEEIKVYNFIKLLTCC